MQSKPSSSIMFMCCRFVYVYKILLIFDKHITEISMASTQLPVFFVAPKKVYNIYWFNIILFIQVYPGFTSEAQNARHVDGLKCENYCYIKHKQRENLFAHSANQETDMPSAPLPLSLSGHLPLQNTFALPKK